MGGKNKLLEYWLNDYIYPFLRLLVQVVVYHGKRTSDSKFEYCPHSTT